MTERHAELMVRLLDEKVKGLANGSARAEWSVDQEAQVAELRRRIEANKGFEVPPPPVVKGFARSLIDGAMDWVGHFGLSGPQVRSLFAVHATYTAGTNFERIAALTNQLSRRVRRRLRPINPPPVRPSRVSPPRRWRRRWMRTESPRQAPTIEPPSASRSHLSTTVFQQGRACRRGG